MILYLSRESSAMQLHVDHRCNYVSQIRVYTLRPYGDNPFMLISPFSRVILATPESITRW